MPAVGGHSAHHIRSDMSSFGESILYRGVRAAYMLAFRRSSGLTQLLAKRSLSEISPLLVPNRPTRFLVLLFEDNLKKMGLTSLSFLAEESTRLPVSIFIALKVSKFEGCL